MAELFEHGVIGSSMMTGDSRLEGTPYVRLAAVREVFDRGLRAEPRPSFDEYSWAYLESARVLADHIRQSQSRLDVMGVAVVFLYRHAIETKLKHIFSLLDPSDTATKVGPGGNKILHDLVAWLAEVERLVQKYLNDHRDERWINHPDVAGIPPKVSPQTRETLEALCAREGGRVQYPERFPHEQWIHEYDLPKFVAECESAWEDLNILTWMIAKMESLKTGQDCPDSEGQEVSVVELEELEAPGSVDVGSK